MSEARAVVSGVVVSVLLAASLLLGGCSSMRIKPPGIQIDSLRIDSVRVTGMGLDVKFRVRNRDPELLDIERFDYVLKLNGNKLGEGYVTESVKIEGFEEAVITSRFDLNFLRLPGSIKAILDHDEVIADVAGTFYVRRGSFKRKVKFSHEGKVPLRRGGGQLDFAPQQELDAGTGDTGGGGY